MTYHYRAYGLSIASAVPLPFVEQDASRVDRPDVAIRLAAAEEGKHASCDPDDMHFPGGVRFAIARGDEITIHAPAPRDVEELAVFTLCGPLRRLLLLKGLVAIRGSCVAFEQDGEEVAGLILGARGRGASTLAAHALGQGARLVSDGVFVLRDSAAGIRVERGQIRLDLWSDSARHLPAGTPVQPLRAGRSRLGTWPEVTQEESLPVRSILLLSPLRDAPAFTPERSPFAALEGFLQQAQLPLDPNDMPARAAQFAIAARLVEGAQTFHVGLAADAAAHAIQRLLTDSCAGGHR